MVGDLVEKLELREKLFVATKVWTTGRERGIAEMEDSMRKLRSRPIDLMQVHNLVDMKTHLATTWRPGAGAWPTPPCIAG